jgi:hypothetical protein
MDKVEKFQEEDGSVFRMDLEYILILVLHSIYLPIHRHKKQALIKLLQAIYRIFN